MMAVAGLQGLPAQRIRLERIRRALARFPALHRSAGLLLVDWIERNFDSKGALVAGSPGGWPRLAASTLARRRSSGLGSQPLVATGRLKGGFVLRAHSRGVTIANKLPYAAIHQFGLGVPPRPMLPDPTQVPLIVMPAVADHVRKALRKSGENQ